LPENFDECARSGTTTGSGITTSVIHIVIKIFKQVSQASTSQVEEARDKYESCFGLFYNFYHNEID
jgi:hypothetical protein